MMAGQGVRVREAGKAIQKKQSNVKTDATIISRTTMLLCFTLSTIIPQSGYKTKLPLSKYEAEVLASNSVSPNRRSKIFLATEGFRTINRLSGDSYARGKVNERVPYRTTQNVQCNIPVRGGHHFLRFDCEAELARTPKRHLQA
jgi:hypothetical protein